MDIFVPYCHDPRRLIYPASSYRSLDAKRGMLEILQATSRGGQQ